MSSVDQSDLFSRAGRASWHGRYFRCYCPFHGENSGSMPSLLVYKDGAVCLGQCHRSYSLEELDRKLSGNGTRAEKPLLHWSMLTDDLLEEKYREAEGLLIGYWDNNHLSDGVKYLAKRKLQRNAVIFYELGEIDSHIVIPVFGQNGGLMSLVARHLNPPSDAVRYYQCRPPLPYCPNWPRLLKATKILVPYGMFDAIHLDLMLQKYDPDGYFGVVTSTHGKNFKPEWLASFRVGIIPIPDDGEAKAGYKLSAALGWRGLKPLTLPYRQDLKDPADFIEQGYSELLWRHLKQLKD